MIISKIEKIYQYVSIFIFKLNQVKSHFRFTKFRRVTQEDSTDILLSSSGSFRNCFLIVQNGKISYRILYSKSDRNIYYTHSQSNRITLKRCFK